METPRHLLHDLGLLISLSNEGKPIKGKNFEFLDSEATDSEPTKSSEYRTQHKTLGRVYRITYRLKHRLVDYSGKNFIEKGEHIRLFTVVKYDLVSLAQFFAGQSLVVTTPEENQILEISDGDAVFRYAIVSLLRPARE